jgi:uncharacterized protein (TIGR04222 family)
MNVLDLRGPQFLQLYLLLLALATAASLILRRLLRGPGPWSRQQVIELSPLEIAYLSGGESGAVDAAIAVLVQRGVLIADGPTRRISATGIASSNVTVVERAICTLAEGRSRRIDEVRAAARATADPLAHRLRNNELILAPGAMLLARFVPAALMFALLALGIAKVQVGVSRNKPVGLLILLCFATTVIAIAFAAAKLLRTRRGDAVLAKFRSRHTALNTTGRADASLLSEQDVALGMALFGPTILTGTALRHLRTAMRPPDRPSSGNGGGSSCGGGGCGGGGCGGCGGG